MISNSIQRLLNGFLVLGLLLLIPVVSTLSHGKKKHDDDNKKR